MYFKVTMVRGHQGMGVNKGTLTFYYETNSALTAMDMGRRQGGVKHSRLPLNVQPISREEYLEGRSMSAYERAGLKKNLVKTC